MNPLSACKETLKEMKSLLETHPDNGWLKKWARRLDKVIKEARKNRDSHADFVRFHKAYLKIGTGDKDAAGELWKIKVVDADVDPGWVIDAVPLYAKWCKEQDRPILNVERYLKRETWERFVAAKIARKLCKLCGIGTAVDGIYVSEGKTIIHFSTKEPMTSREQVKYCVCEDCKKYNLWKLEDIRKDIKKGGE